jgi:Protein of unknown function (DUF5131)
MARSHGSRLPNRLYQDQGPASPSRRRLSSLRCGPRRSYARSMADKSAIEWTEATWNPATGFDRISSGCDNCYALTLAKRLKAIGNAKYQKDGDPRTSGPGFGGDLHPSALGLPYTWREPRRVFVTSMSDLFHAHVPTCFVAEVFKVMVETPRHSYQVLTKRPRRVARLAASLPWPENIWMGVTLEDQKTTWRADACLQVGNSKTCRRSRSGALLPVHRIPARRRRHPRGQEPLVSQTRGEVHRSELPVTATTISCRPGSHPALR